MFHLNNNIFQLLSKNQGLFFDENKFMYCSVNNLLNL